MYSCTLAMWLCNISLYGLDLVINPVATCDPASLTPYFLTCRAATCRFDWLYLECIEFHRLQAPPDG